MIDLARIPALLLLASCSQPDTTALSPPGSRPLLRAVEGASAVITIITCAPTESRAAGVGEIIRDLIQQDELVLARSGGSARLVINTCPFPAPPVGATAARR